MNFLSYLINGISLGSVYAIIALGYTMVYGIAKMLNFAHGDVIMVGCYIVFMTMSGQGWGAVPAVVLSIIVCTLLGIVIENRIQTTPKSNSFGSSYHSHRCQLFLRECGIIDFRRRYQIIYKCSNTSGIETGRWSTHNLKHNNCYIFSMCCDHGCTDAFYQENQSRSGNACSI